MLFTLPIAQLIAPNGGPLQGWSVAFFDGQTSTPLIAYKDAACVTAWGITVTADSFGRLPAIWLKPTGRTYRATITYPDGRSKSIDGLQLPNALDSTGTSVTYAAPQLPLSTKSGTSVTLAVVDFAHLISVQTGVSTEVPVNLPPIGDVANGSLVAVRNAGSGRLRILPHTNDGDAIPVIEPYGVVWIAATPTTYVVVARTPPIPIGFIALNRTTTSPPTGALAGDTYLAGSGASNGWTAGLIYVSRGDDTWAAFSPKFGTTVTLASEFDDVIGPTNVHSKAPLQVVWDGVSWINRHDLLVAAVAKQAADQTAALKAATVNVVKAIKVLSVSEDASSGTLSITSHGGTPGNDAWIAVNLNTVHGNGIAGAQLLSKTITLPVGDYAVDARRTVSNGQGSANVRFRSTDNAVVIAGLAQPLGTGGETGLNTVLLASGSFSITAAKQFLLEVYLHGVTGPAFLGTPASIGTETYATVDITSLRPV